GESELSGGVQWIELQRVLEGINGLRKLFRLHVGSTQEIPCVRIVGVDLDYVMKGLDRGLGVACIFGQQAEVVPGVRILWILLQRIFQRDFGIVNLLHVEQSDAFIQPRHGQRGIEFGGLLEGLQSLLEKLLVHVGRSEIVQARSLDGVAFRWTLRWTWEQAKRGQQRASDSN